MSSGSASSTGNWEGKLFYVPEAKLYPESGSFEPLDAIRKNSNLKKDFEEKVYNVYSYKAPLFAKFPPKIGLFHRYIIIKTTHHWFSIEKNKLGIFLQRGSNEDDVLKMCNGVPRAKSEKWLIKEEETSSKSKHVTMEELFAWLKDKGGSFDQFHLLFRNCKKFGKDTVEFFKEKKIKKP